MERFSHHNVFNPYTNICTEYDDELSPLIRKTNLIDYLRRCQDLELDTLWMGEALGYRGGRRTGLPFSDDKHLNKFDNVYGTNLRKATIRGDLYEITAKTIWEMVDQLENPPILWNIFPFHPYNNTQLSNRKPIAEELELGFEIFNDFMDLFELSKIYTIGRTPEKWLKRQKISCEYIRHPSYGGVKIFKRQIREKMKLKK